MIDRVRAWCEERPDVRAALLTGSRGRVGAPVDRLSDWDVALFVDDPARVEAEPGWWCALGPVLVAIPESFEALGRRIATRLVWYEDGSRIDFSVFPIDALRALSTLAELPPWLDAGYRVLVDHEGLAAKMVPPQGRGWAGRPPHASEVRADIEEFWWESLVVAKALARDEPFAAAYSGEAVMRHGLLLRMLQWRAGAANGWTDPAGPCGRGLARLLPAALAARAIGPVDAWRGGSGWSALERLADLYGEVAREVAADLGMPYPDALETRVRAAVHDVRGATG